jgi:hypothetical protein
MVIIVAIGLVGAGTAVAAASGAFDQQANRAAVQSIREFVRSQMQIDINRQFAGEFQSAAKSLKPKDVLLQVTARGPGYSIFMVWTYSHHPNGPWCSVLVTTVPGKAPLTNSMTCQVGGKPTGSALASEDQWPCTPVPHHVRTLEPSLFIIRGEVPAGVAKVVVHTPKSGTVEASVTNGWFVAISARSVPSPISETYLGASGEVIGNATINPSSSTC